MAPPISADTRLGPQARAAVLAGLLLALSGAARAAAPPAWILSEVRVTGGNPIAGVPDEIIFRQRIDADCRPVVEQPPQPFSVPLRYPPGQAPTLHLGFAACRGGASRRAPSGPCTLRIGNSAPLHLPAGKPVDVPIPLPTSTGLYRVTLVCPAAGPVATDLYVTYARPQEPMEKPTLGWYRAVLTSWGQGFPATTPESELLAAMLRGIYAHGQRSWRYGFCKSADGWCQFGRTRIEASSKKIQGNCFKAPSDGVTVCKCLSEFVVAGDSCNFTDCFGFTEILQASAAVQGSTGFFPITELGAQGKGFALPTGARSLDPSFAGDLTCGERNTPCAYIFGNHSLLGRPGQRYDPTFGKIYQGVQGLINESAEQWSAAFGTEALFPSFRACPGQRGYGQFRLYRKVVPRELPCMPAGSPAAELTGVVSWEGARSNDGDPQREAVAVGVEVKAQKAGRFIVGGGLFSGTEPVSLTGRLDMVEAPVGAVLDMQQGETRKAILLFAGEPLVRLGARKPVALHALLVDEEGHVFRGELPLPPLPESLLGDLDEPAALFTPGAAEQARAEIVKEEGRTALRVTAPVVIRQGGWLSVEARLASGLETLAYAGYHAEFAERAKEITLDFPVDEIAAERREGTYAVTLLLYTPGPEGTLSRFEDALELSIGPFHPADFR